MAGWDSLLALIFGSGAVSNVRCYRTERCGKGPA